MKKVLFIILGLLCAFSAFAIGYASPYKGSAHSGYMHMTSSARVHSIGGGGGGLAQTPAVSMRSTSRAMSTTSSYTSNVTMTAMPAVKGMYTSASAISGGVTTYDSGRRNVTGRRKTEVVPGKPEECYCEDLNGDGFCDHCGAAYDEFDGGCSNNPCLCPIGDGKEVWMFIVALAAAYAVYKNTKKQEKAQVI